MCGREIDVPRRYLCIYIYTDGLILYHYEITTQRRNTAHPIYYIVMRSYIVIVYPPIIVYKRYRYYNR